MRDEQKTAVGGVIAVLAALGAGVARFGDDIGHFLGTAGRVADDAAMVGADVVHVADDVGRMGDGAVDLGRMGDGAVELGRAAELAEVGAHGGTSEALGHAVDALSAGLDLASVGADGTTDPALVTLSALDRTGASGEPQLALDAPNEGTGPQLVLVRPGVSPDEVVTKCALGGRWCIAEAAGREDGATVRARFESRLAWWRETHPSDAAWIAAVGADTPAGAPVAWITATGDKLALAHP